MCCINIDISLLVRLGLSLIDHSFMFHHLSVLEPGYVCLGSLVAFMVMGFRSWEIKVFTNLRGGIPYSSFRSVGTFLSFRSLSIKSTQ